MIRIILAEDDDALRGVVASALIRDGYDVTACRNGTEAFESFETGGADMLVTDILMPGMDGFELAKRVRAADKRIPILFMTALDDTMSKKKGYTLGIDDYVEKPFDMELFLLRVASLLRRADIQKSKEIVAGNLRMNEEEHTAYMDGAELPLTVREFDLLFKLLSYPKRTFTRMQLMDDFWGYDSSATSRTVDVYMAKLREKTAGCTGFEIVTVHGLGYKAVLR